MFHKDPINDCERRTTYGEFIGCPVIYNPKRNVWKSWIYQYNPFVCVLYGLNRQMVFFDYKGKKTLWGAMNLVITWWWALNSNLIDVLLKKKEFNNKELKEVSFAS